VKPKITMQDIADTLSISKNSVSQALSDKSGVSEETRKLIVDTAEGMGYVYSKSRKKRDTESSGNIGFIASDFAFSKKNFFWEIYLSIEKEVAKRGMRLQIQSIDNKMSEKMELPAFLQDQSVDGILVLSHISTDYTNAIIDTGIPTVLIDHHEPTIYADSILTNNRFGAYDIVKYLIEQGHRHIGYIGNIDFSPSYYERLEGYRLALYKYNLDMNPNWVLTDAKEQTHEVLASIKSLPTHPSAWFCVNDGFGFMVNSAYQQLGFTVPSDVSICSFDNGILSQIATPMLTTMNIDLQYFGKKAVKQLFWRMNHKDEPFMEILLPAKLIVRESTAPFVS
jgi:LacI family transcriptional regulator